MQTASQKSLPRRVVLFWGPTWGIEATTILRRKNTAKRVHPTPTHSAGALCRVNRKRVLTANVNSGGGESWPHPRDQQQIRDKKENMTHIRPLCSLGAARPTKQTFYFIQPSRTDEIYARDLSVRLMATEHLYRFPLISASCWPSY